MQKRVLIVVIIVLIFALGIGLLLFIRAQRRKAEEAQQIRHQKTVITTYTPPTNLSGISTEEGSCWTNSIAAPYRTDAWRCMVGNSISDPCFTTTDPSKLLCDPDPSNQQKTKPFVLSLTQPLPTGADQPMQANAPWGWLIQLADGTICTPLTGTRAIMDDGTPTTYSCNNPSEGTVFGDLIDNGNGTWSATVGTFSVPQDKDDLPAILSSQTVLVKAVWQ